MIALEGTLDNSTTGLNKVPAIYDDCQILGIEFQHVVICVLLCRVVGYYIGT